MSGHIGPNLWPFIRDIPGAIREFVTSVLECFEDAASVLARDKAKLAQSAKRAGLLTELTPDERAMLAASLRRAMRAHSDSWRSSAWEEPK